jgi:hypothetical protein
MLCTPEVRTNELVEFKRATMRAGCGTWTEQEFKVWLIARGWEREVRFGGEERWYRVF